MKILAHITNGHMDLQSRTSVALWCKKTKNGQAILEIKAPTKQRSNQESKYYWAVVVGLISQELGYTPEETHETLKAHFLMETTGKLPKIISTADLSTTAFEQYMKTIREWAAVDLNIFIPLPGEAACELLYP